MSSRIVGFALTALVAVSLLATPAAAQQGTITGRVVDASTFAPLSLVQISVDGGVAAVTDARGSFTFQIAAGTYQLEAILIGYGVQSQTVTVTAGGTATADFSLFVQAISLRDIVVTSDAQRTERSTQSLPIAFDVVPPSQIEAQAGQTPVDYVKSVPGVDAIQTGINQSNTVARGFNNVFSGALLVLTDNRYARVPSLRLNAFNMIPAPMLDVERVEVFLGPASALYGPNSANGVMHIITSNPIDKPGTTVSVSGGSQSIFQGAFRQNFRFSEKVGLKVTGQYFRGEDFVYRDPVEEAAKEDNPDNPLIAARDFDAERYSGEVRLDVRPWEGSSDGLKFTYGLNNLGSSIELTGIGAGQAQDWKYQFGQVQFERKGLFVQGFMNASDAGDSYLLRTGQPIIDKSTVVAAQAQYAFNVTSFAELVAGLDYSKTTPKTEGSITGANEDSDETTEVGGYLSGTFRLASTLDLVGALRVDDHEHLEDQVWSPRVGLVFTPRQGQAFRATFNRAFSTPTTNNLFLDITAGRIPITSQVGYRVQTVGVPSTGFTWDNRCAGGVDDYCMYSPFAPGTQLPATGTVFWDNVVVPTALQNPELQAALQLLNLTPEQFATILANPTPADMGSTLLRFNSEDPSNPFVPDPGVSALARMKPTITNTYEVGYQGLLAGRFNLSVSAYRSEIEDFVGPLRVETPTVFLNGQDVATFVAGRLINAGVPAGPAAQIAAQIAPTAARVPFGTVAPDQRASDDVLLTYRNFGAVDLWGTDIGFEAYATDEFIISGSYSHVSEQCFDVDEDGACSSAADIALNAPSNKGTLGARYLFPDVGLEIGARGRYSEAFLMNSGVYVGEVEEFTVFDANIAWRVPGYQGLIASLTVNNLTDNRRQEFVGAPEIGRIALLKLQYTFGGG
jgi:outer membrane receptor for ferrienterochelin and colicins